MEEAAMNSVNFAEIFIVNGIGICLMAFLRVTRIENIEENSFGERLYNIMLWLTIAGCFVESLTFVIDGRIFWGCRAISYLLNSFCFIGTCTVGYLWCLYMDFRIFGSMKRIRRQYKALALPLAVDIGMNLINLSGCGIVFTISPDNIYRRGSLVLTVYVILFFYFFYSIYIARRSQRIGLHMRFLPMYNFVAPCMLGTFVQGMAYGITLGWTAVAIALTLVYMETQSLNVYVDSLSGLYNRRYMDSVFNGIKNGSQFRLHGIMIDVNGFKQINDLYGHTAGDDAIRQIGRILLDSVPENGIAIRYAGDEFLLLLHADREETVKDVMQVIRQNVSQLNDSGQNPYKLSFAMGYSGFDHDSGGKEAFLSDMDKKMYEEKKLYYLNPDMNGIQVSTAEKKDDF